MRSLRTVTATLLTAVLLGASALPVSAFGMVRTSGTGASTRATAATPANGPLATTPASSAIRAGRVIVRLKGAPTAAKLQRVYRSADTSVGAVQVIRGDVLLWRVPAGTSDAAFAARLEASGDVAYAELNYTRKLAGVYTPPAYVAPNEPAYSDTYKREERAAEGYPPQWVFPMARSWWLRDIRATEMWAGAYTGSSTFGKYPLRANGEAFKVAVLDTGFWGEHEDGKNVDTGQEFGWDTYDNDSDTTPPDLGSLYAEQDATMVAAHGTNVAGLVGAEVGNGIGSFGSGYDTRVVMYKVAGAYKGRLVIPDDAVVSAIMRAADNGCKVISMSFVDSYDSAAIRDAVNYAYGKGCILVAARGNTGSAQLLYPAVLPHVVGVGAIAKASDGFTSIRAFFSSTGSGLDISAPGQAIWGLTQPATGESGSGYDWWNGTSMATPITAGALALLWRAAPDLTGDEIVAIAQSSAKDLGAAGWDTQTGWGELDMAAAYNKLKTTYPLLKPPTITVPASPSIRAVPITWSKVAGYQVRYNVKLDGVSVATGLSATGTVLPKMSAGSHTVVVTPTSVRNWSDSSAARTRVFTATESYPVMLSVQLAGAALSWKSTESADTAAHYHLAIDGGDVRNVYADSYDISGLALGYHTAQVAVVDGAGKQSDPLTIRFRAWPLPTVKRIGGADRYAVNAALASDTFTTATNAVMVAGDTWPDALSASPLAKKLSGPVLLTRRDSIPSNTSAALKRLDTKKVVIVGGTGSVSDAVAASLRRSGITVTRLAGPDRYTTAEAVARELYRLSGSQIPDHMAVVASGVTPQHALIGSAAAARKGWPVLLTRQTGVPASTLSTLRAIGVTGTIVVGPTAAVSSGALAQLPAAKRLGASTYAGTSVAVATWATHTYPADFIGERYYVASDSELKYADSLGVGAAAGKTGGLILLTSTTLSPEVSAYYKAHAADAVTTRIMGGTATIPQVVMDAIKALVGAP